MGVKQLTLTDLTLIHDNAVGNFVALPGRCRLPGMIRDLNDDEKRTLSYFLACASHLNRCGVGDPKLIEELLPRPYTAVQEVLEDEQYSVSTK